MTYSIPYVFSLTTYQNGFKFSIGPIPILVAFGLGLYFLL